MKARNLTREQVLLNDVLLAAQPTKQFVTVEQVAALAVFLPATPLLKSPAPIFRWMADGLRRDAEPRRALKPAALNCIPSVGPWLGRRRYPNA